MPERGTPGAGGMGTSFGIRSSEARASELAALLCERLGCVAVALCGSTATGAAIRRGDVAAHAQAMHSLVARALLGAGAFALAPRRRLNVFLLGHGAGWSESVLMIGPVLARAVWLAWRWRILAGPRGRQRALPPAFRRV